MNKQLLDYKQELHLDIDIGSQYESSFPEESFFEVATEKLSEAGILDNVEHSLFRDTKRGLRVDGYSWNELERTLCIILVKLSADATDIDRLNQTEINGLAQRPRKFVEAAFDNRFVSSLDPSSDGYNFVSYIKSIYEEVVKFRFVIITDYLLSDRVKSIKLEPLQDKASTIEVWDLQRLMALDSSDSDSEPFTVNSDLLGGGLAVIRGAELPGGARSYLGVMPAQLLSNIYDEFGQRLLEGNVRTFLDFRSGVNKGLRRTLLLEPDNFFAYNNGITLTADAAEIENIGDYEVIKSLQNLQIVNGGQTTASIYFAPKDPGGIKTPDGELQYKSIDLSRVSVQMKLTVFSADNKEFADNYRSQISRFANSQNSVQESDLVSNHPFHMTLERLSRQILMPADDTGLATKRFYERTRGQYSTLLRAKGSAANRSKFELEFPKKLVFTKTDMAKYENTWRMMPHTVKKGAQANLKALGPVLAAEYEANPENFEAGFYKDLVSKMIIFRAVDQGVLKADWYKEEGGLKAEAVTFGIALLRKTLLKSNLDINLDRIYSRQSLSVTLLNKLIYSCQRVRTAISDPAFRGGTGNPSEFCKSENGWKKIQAIQLDLVGLDRSDVMSLEEKEDSIKETREVNKVSKTVSDYEKVFAKGISYWQALATFNLSSYAVSDIQVALPTKCVQMLKGGRALTDKQMSALVRVSQEAEKNGFEHIAN